MFEGPQGVVNGHPLTSKGLSIEAPGLGGPGLCLPNWVRTDLGGPARGGRGIQDAHLAAVQLSTGGQTVGSRESA